MMNDVWSKLMRLALRHSYISPLAPIIACPYHLDLLSRIFFAITPTFVVPLILSFSYLVQRRNSLISATSNSCSCAVFNAHVSAPYTSAGLTSSTSYPWSSRSFVCQTLSSRSFTRSALCVWLPHPVIRQRRSQACQCLHTLYCLSMEMDLYILMSIAPQWTSRRRTSERNSKTCFRNQSDLIEGTHYRGLHKKCRHANYSQTHIVSLKHYSHVRFRKHNQCGFVLTIRTHTGYAS